MRTIIFLVIAVLLFSVVLDSVRKQRRKKDSGDAPSERLVSANDLPPTETGRMRVQHIVKALKKNSPDATIEEKKGEQHVDDVGGSETLPDPFDSKK